MVATTKGPVAAPGGKDVPPEERPDAAAGQVRNSVDLDEETYNRVLQLAASQQATPGEVIRRTIINAFGVGQPIGAWHSGQPDDPALQSEENSQNTDDATGTAADPDESSMTGKKDTGSSETAKPDPSAAKKANNKTPGK